MGKYTASLDQAIGNFKRNERINKIIDSYRGGKNGGEDEEEIRQSHSVDWSPAIETQKNAIVTDYTNRANRIAQGADEYATYSDAAKNLYQRDVKDFKNYNNQLKKYDVGGNGSILGNMLESGKSVSDYADYKIKSYVTRDQIGALSRFDDEKQFDMQRYAMTGKLNYDGVGLDAWKHDQNMAESQTQAEQVLDRLRSGDHSPIDQLTEDIKRLRENNQLSRYEADRYQLALNRMQYEWNETGEFQNTLNTATDEELQKLRDELQGQRDAIPDNQENAYSASALSRLGNDQAAGEMQQQLQADAENAQALDTRLSQINKTLNLRERQEQLEEFNNLAFNRDFEETVKEYKRTHNTDYELRRLGSGMDVNSTGVVWDVLTSDFAGMLGGEYLTDEQKDTYIYIRSKYGAERAGEYWNTVKDTLNLDLAEKFTEKTGTGAIKYPMAALLGLSNSFESVEQWFTDKPLNTVGDYLNDIYQQNVADVTDDDGNVVQNNVVARTAYSTIYSAGNMVVPMAITAATGGSSATMMGAFFVTAGGSARRDALQEGYSNDQAYVYGAIEGLSEAFMERALSAAPASVKAMTSGTKLSMNMASKLTGALDNVFAKSSTRNAFKLLTGQLGGAAGEFIEEYAQQIMEPVYRNIAFGEKNKFEFYNQEALEAGISGAILGSVFGSANLIGNYNNAVNYQTDTITGEKQSVKSLGMQAVLDAAETFDVDSDVYKVAQEIKNNPAKSKFFENIDKIELVTEIEKETYAKEYNAAVEQFRNTTAQDASDLLESMREGKVSDAKRKAMSDAFTDVYFNNFAEYLSSFDATAEAGTQGNEKLRMMRTGENATVAMGDGNYVSVDDVEYANNDERILYQHAAKYASVRDANAMIQFFSQSDLLKKGNVEQAIGTYESLYDYGIKGSTLEQAKQSEAWKYGKELGISEPVLEQIYKQAISNVENTADQRIVTDLANRLNVKVDFVTGLVTTTTDGQVIAANGRYNPKTKTIEINVASHQSVVTVFAHEFTHSMQETRPNLYSEFKSKVLDILRSEDNLNRYNEMYETVKKVYGNAEGEISQAEIEDEIVAMSAENFIFEPKFVEQLRQEEGLFKRVKAFFQSFIRRMFTGDIRTDETRKNLAEMLGAESQQENFNQALDLWLQGFNSDAEVEENHQAAQEEYREQIVATETELFSLNPYTERQKENWKQSTKIVLYENEQQLIDFVNKALAEKEFKKKLYFGTVGEVLAEKIKQETGYDFLGRNVSLRADNIKKVYKDHGTDAEEELRGHRGVMPTDYAKIPEVLNYYETINASEYKGHPAIEIKKEIDGERYTLVMVDSKSSLEIFLQTMYVGKKKRSLSRLTDASNAPQSFTSETPTETASSVIKLSQNEKNDNTKHLFSIDMDSLWWTDEAETAGGNDIFNQGVEALKNVTFNDATVNDIYRKVFGDLKTDYSADKAKQFIKNVAAFLQKNENISYDDFVAVTQRMVKPIMERSYDVVDEELRNRFRGEYYYVPDNQLNDFLTSTGFENLKQVNNALLKFGVTFTREANKDNAKQTARSFDTDRDAWDAVVAEFPGLAEYSDSSVGDQAAYFVAELLNAEEENKQYFSDDYAEEMALDYSLKLIQNILTNEQVREKHIQKAANRKALQNERAKANEARTHAIGVITSADAVIEERVAEIENWFKAERDRIREKYNQKIKEAREQNVSYRNLTRAKIKESYARAKQFDTARSNVYGMLKMIDSPTKSKHWARELVPYLADVVNMLDITSNKEVSKTNNAIQAMVDKVNDVRSRQFFNELTGEYEDIYKDETGKFYDQMTAIGENIKELVAGRKLNQLTSAELKQLNKYLQGIKNMNRDATTFIGSGISRDGQTIQQAIEESRQAIASTKGSAGLKNFYATKMLNPERFFRRITGYKDCALNRAVAGLNEGAVKESNIKMGAWALFDMDKNQRKEYEKLNRTWETVTLGGKQVEVTRGMVLSIAMQMHSEENIRHMTSYNVNGEFTDMGGIYIQQKDAYKKGNYREAATRAQRVIPTRAELEAIANGSFSEFENWFMEQLDEYYNKYSKNIINQTSFEIEGFERADVENYYPLNIAPQRLNAKGFNYANGTYAQELSTGGKLTPRNPKSTMAIILNDATHDLTHSIDFTARYGGMAIPMRDFSKIINGVSYGEANVNFIQDAIMSQYGEEAVKYIENFIKDLNGSRSGGDNLFFGKLKNNAAQAVLTLNPSVALKQTASFPTAIAELDYKSVMKALMAGGQNNWMLSRADQELIAKYTPLLWERMQGMSTQELAEINTSYKSVIQRGMDKLPMLTQWIQKMDVATVGRLWYATQYWVDDQIKKRNINYKQLEKGSDEYYKAVADKFNKVVQRTQPNYNVLGRPEILRNPSQLWRAVMMFKTQPMQNFGILFDAVGEYNARAKEYKTLKESGASVSLMQAKEIEVKQALAKRNRAVTSQIVQTMTFTAFTVIANIVLHRMDKYRDDDDELTVASFAEQFGWDFLDSFMGNFAGLDWLEDAGAYGFQKYIQGKENASYYPPTVFGMEEITDLISNLDELGEKIQNGKEIDYLIEKIGLSLADLSGIPASNIKKIYKSINGYVTDIGAEGFSGLWGQFSLEGDGKPDIKKTLKKIFKANENGEDTSELWDEMLTQIDNDPETSQSALESQLQTAYIDAYQTGDTNTMNAISKWYVDKLGFTQEKTQEIINGWLEANYNDYKDEWKAADSGDRKALLKRMADETGTTESEVRDSIKGWVSEYADEYRRASAARQQEIEKDMRDIYGLTESEIIKKTGSWKFNSSAETKTQVMDNWYQKYKNGSSEESPYKTLDQSWFVSKWESASASEKETLKKMAVEVFGKSDKTEKDGTPKIDKLIDKWVNGSSGDSKGSVGSKLDEWYSSGASYDVGITHQNNTGVSGWLKERYKQADDAERARIKELAVNYLGYSASHIDTTAEGWLK